MPIINEITIGTVSSLNGMTMFRKYDGEKGFEPYFKFIDDNTLAMDSNIIVNYIEYFKNSLGVLVKELTKYKLYVVPNIPAVLYTVGDIITPAILYIIGETITPAVLYVSGETMANGTIASGGEVKTPAVLSNGTEIKVHAVIAVGTEIKKAAWLGANRWFLSVARTPMTAPYGIMDGIEATLAGLPINVPNGYVLQGPL